jgi:hypothetical protein
MPADFHCGKLIVREWTPKTGKKCRAVVDPTVFFRFFATQTGVGALKFPTLRC